MQSIFGTKVSRTEFTPTFYTGIANALPIAINPTVEELENITEGKIKLSKITYNKPAIHVWYKLVIRKEADGSLKTLMKTTPTEENEFVHYVKGVIFVENLFTASDKGSWKVNLNFMLKEWVNANGENKFPISQSKISNLQTIYNVPVTMLPAKKGTLELISFLSNWLGVEYIDSIEPFEVMLQNGFRCIKELVYKNLNTKTNPDGSERTPEFVGIGLGVSENDYVNQDVFSNKFFTAGKPAPKSFINDFEKWKCYESLELKEFVLIKELVGKKNDGLKPPSKDDDLPF